MEQILEKGKEPKSKSLKGMSNMLYKVQNICTCINHMYHTVYQNVELNIFV